MSKYTTEVRYICQSYSGLDESANVEDIIYKSVNKIFDFYIPFFDYNYLNELYQKILLHYYTREIAHETVGLWKLKMKSRLMDILPYYNKLYESELLKFNPLNDVEFEKTGNTTGNTKNNSKVNANNEEITKSESKGDNKQDSQTIDKNLFSDTPQGALVGVENETYLTNARKTTTTDNISHNTHLDFDETKNHKINSGTDFSEEKSGDYFEKIIGKTGGKSYSKLLIEFRQTFLNIDKMVIDELQDLFFGLW